MGTRASFLLLLTLIVGPSSAQTFEGRAPADSATLERQLDAESTRLNSADAKEKPQLAETHVRTHLRLAHVLADERRYALGVAVLRRAKAAAYRHMLPKRSREVIAALDDQIVLIEWREKSDGRGLRCELFADTDFADLKKTRIDHELDFLWRSAAPDIDVPGDSFSARWTGFLRAPVAGRYRIIIHGDDRTKLWIDDQLIAEANVNLAEAFIDLTGKPQSLRVDHIEAAGEACLSLRWVVPGNDRVTIVPPDCFFTTAESADRLAGKRLTLPKGRGVRTDVFGGRDFRILLVSRVDADIDSLFHDAAPDPRLAGAFSIRCSTFLKAPEPGLYKLTASVDDGVRLWIDNHLVLERWPSFLGEHSVTLPLTGKPQPLVLEFHNIAGLGWLSLHWQRMDQPDAPRVPIPPEAFFTDRGLAERSGLLEPDRAP